MVTVLKGQDNFNSDSVGVGTTVDAVKSYGLFGNYDDIERLPNSTLFGASLDYQYSVYSFNYAALTQSPNLSLIHI